ncbi:MAG: hypothetical protein ACOCXA_05750, partial [Planctomycetota bacterium]
HLRHILPVLLSCTALSAAEDWYRFTGSPVPSDASLIACDDWLLARGRLDQRIHMQDDRLLLEGEPVKLWGVNTNFANNCPEPAVAIERADFFAHGGVNLVRLHKLTGAGWAGFGDPASALKFDAQSLDNFDHYVHQSRERGIRYCFSAVFKFRVGPEDRDRIPFFDEAFEIKKRGGVKGDAYSMVMASPALQELVIEQMVKLLEHRNPHSGLRYVDDPALVYIETLNEENLYFFSSMGAIQKVPTLKRSYARQFSQWLKEHYGSQEALAAAWGKGLDGFSKLSYPDENLSEENIYPVGNPWYFAREQLEGSQKPYKQRLIDTMLFMHDRQVAFFERYRSAMEEAGFEGFFVGSNWQAGDDVGHYLNLHSDALMGMIDRHNYFGGSKEPKKGPFKNASMLSVPGGGFFSAGMQQVADRPFMLSEWAHVAPNEWAGEGPAIIAAYGLGLQGWDAATYFTQRRGGTNGVGNDMFASKWDVGTPNVYGLYPTWSRMVMRGDVEEAAVLGRLPVSMEALQRGDLPFQTSVEQAHDVKTFSTDAVPAAALAVGRCVVDFVEEPEPVRAVDLEAHRRGGALHSTTGQLRWHQGDGPASGWCVIDTAGTKAVIGFLPAEPIELGAVTITPERAGFAIIALTALEQDCDLSNSEQVLVTALARARNTGMKLNPEENAILQAGKPPLLMESMAARIDLGDTHLAQAVVLDHDGRATQAQAPLSDGTLSLDTARDESMYILLTP